MSGWYKQQRNLSERAWYKDSLMVHLYHFLKERAYVTDGQYEGKLIRRGSCPVTRSEMSEVTGMSYRTLDRVLKKLISFGEIIVKANNRFSVITICDYDSSGMSESLFGTTNGITDGTASGITNGITVGTADGTTHLLTIEERYKEDKNILVSSLGSYKKEREEENQAYEIKRRYNKTFDGKLPPLLRLTMPTKLMVGECLRRFGSQSIDIVFDQILHESFSLGNNRTGFIANFQFIFDPKNFQQYLERAQLRKRKQQEAQDKPQPQQEQKSVGVIKEEPQRRVVSDEERKRTLLELIEYIEENPRSLSCDVLEDAYRTGELQRLGIEWKPKNI